MTWLRRNWIALLSLVVIIPATIGLTFSAQWQGYFDSRPSEPQIVAVNQSATYGTAEWQVTGSERYASNSPVGRDAGLPNNTDLIVVTFTVNPIRVDKDGASTSCTIDLNELEDDTIVRSWGDASFNPIEYRPDAAVGCATENQSMYETEIYFTVPSDAGTGGRSLALNLSVADQLPRYLRLYF